MRLVLQLEGIHEHELLRRQVKSLILPVFCTASAEEGQDVLGLIFWSQAKGLRQMAHTTGLYSNT
jgi:hypothetical protein